MKRKKIHAEYYAIPAYQRLAKKKDEEMAKLLKICARTYRDRIKGYSDFSTEDGKILSSLFGMPQEQIFLTDNMSKTEQ